VKSPKNWAFKLTFGRLFGRLDTVIGMHAMHICMINVCELREDARI